jgi:hypothetical protein
MTQAETCLNAAIIDAIREAVRAGIDPSLAIGLAMSSVAVAAEAFYGRGADLRLCREYIAHHAN